MPFCYEGISWESAFRCFLNKAFSWKIQILIDSKTLGDFWGQSSPGKGDQLNWAAVPFANGLITFQWEMLPKGFIEFCLKFQVKMFFHYLPHEKLRRGSSRVDNKACLGWLIQVEVHGWCREDQLCGGCDSHGPFCSTLARGRSEHPAAPQGLWVICPFCLSMRFRPVMV